jgi:ornithine cyclodeaminase/alanine dehydrogenase
MREYAGRGVGPVFISAAAAESVFSWSDGIAAIRAAYAVPPDPAALPPRTVGRRDGSWLRTLPALPAGRYFGAKVMGMSTTASSPRVEYVVVLYDRETSKIAAFVDAQQVTAYRTAATSAAAVDLLAPRGAVRMAVLGSGLEASMHVRAFRAVREVEELTVFSPRRERRLSFAAAFGGRAADDPRDAVAGATLVLAAARSRGEVPILYGDWLAPRAVVVSIGSTVPEQREIDTTVVERADLIVCDDVPEVAHETGDMIEAARAGVEFAAKTFPLHALVAGDLDARVRSAELALFKSVGSGLQDVVVASLVLERAKAAGLATTLPIEFSTRT